MQASASDRVVLADANVLINFLRLEKLDLLGNLPEHEFLVPDHVVEEISDPTQRERLDEGVRAGFLSMLSLRHRGKRLFQGAVGVLSGNLGMKSSGSVPRGIRQSRHCVLLRRGVGLVAQGECHARSRC